MASLVPRRVVVTGIGAISPLGNTFRESWDALLRNESGMTTLEEALTTHQGLQPEALERELLAAKPLLGLAVAPVKGLEQEDASRTSRFCKLTLVAGAEAMEQAKLLSWIGDEEDDASQERRERIGVCIGSAFSGVREILNSQQTFLERGLRRLSPHFIPKVLTNSASGRLSLAYKFQGPNLAPSTACAAGSHAIGEAMRCIQYDNADIMLAGGAESCIDPLTIGSFRQLRALSTNPDPSAASRPFDSARDGFVMGEGASILVLEEMGHAKARGATILAELTGYGLSGDAFHVTAPDSTGRGASRAMEMALKQHGSDGQDIGYVNAHATSTPIGDDIESRTIDKTLAGSSDLYVSSSKGSTGHLLGAAGALEAAFTVMALHEQVVPPTRNLSDINGAGNIGFRHAADAKVPHTFRTAMNNSFGFGGTNASLVFSLPR